jgi:hypothetical protein
MIFLCGTQDGDGNEYMVMRRTLVYTMYFTFLGKNVRLSLCLINCYTTETYGGSGYLDPCILDLGTS